MILKALNELYPRLAKDADYKIAKTGFSDQKISFRVVLNPDGSLFKINDARSPDAKGKFQNVVLQVPGGAKPSGSALNPCFLWDNPTYLLGQQPEDKAEGFGWTRFEAFRDKHLKLEKVINDPDFSLLCRFLESWTPEQLAAHPELLEFKTGFGVFQIKSRKKDLHEQSRIRDWWLANLPKTTDSQNGTCSITGEEGPIARLHPKIKGVTGAQSSGASLVSFNDRAYESYGKSQGENAPIGEATAEHYGLALNALLTGPQSHQHRLRIGDTTTVFWTGETSYQKYEASVVDLLGSGSNLLETTQDQNQRERIERFLKAIQTGKAFADYSKDSDTPFYILGLAPNAARLSIRFFYSSTIESLLENLKKHHDCLHIVREFKTAKGKRLPDPKFPAIWQLLRETARVADEISPLLGGALARAIVQGTPYPEALFTAVIRRIHADRSINYLRAAILKAVLTRNHNKKIEAMLDKSEKVDPAYRQGRLFATLEKIQEDGYSAQTNGKHLKKTIRDRYFSSASATPTAVMPRLEQLSTYHQQHLKAEKKIYYDKLIAEIKWPISPRDAQKKTLTLFEQGLFILGYYHQRRDFFTKKDDK